MNPHYTEPRGLARYAKFDLADSRHRIRRQVHQPTWQGVYVYLLRQLDYAAAELVRLRNDRKYAQDIRKGR